MGSYVKMSRNLVNLGRLYNRLPMPPINPVENFVNLGNLFAPPPAKRPFGWAYFEDGSVFIRMRKYVDHNTLEAEMRLVQHFIRDPSPDIAKVRNDDPTQSRLIVIVTSNPTDLSYSILARNARDKQKVVMENASFVRVDFELNKFRSYPVSAQFTEGPVRINELHKHRIKQTLTSSFRGTLIEGILQPNVRLGNGLTFTNSANLEHHCTPDVAHILSENYKRGLSIAKGDLSETQPLYQHERILRDRQETHPADLGRDTLESDLLAREQSVKRREAQLKEKEQDLLHLQQQLAMQLVEPPRRNLAADIEAKERELQQREETLKWKHRSFFLQQKLDMATKSMKRRIPSKSSAFRNTTAAAEASPADSEPRHGEGERDAFDDFDMQDPSPPPALAKLRSRIQLPITRVSRTRRY